MQSTVENPKVSVIVPCYNVGQYVERFMRCLKNQTMTDFETICIDDGSSDNTIDVLK